MDEQSGYQLNLAANYLRAGGEVAVVQAGPAEAAVGEAGVHPLDPADSVQLREVVVGLLQEMATQKTQVA